MSRISSLFLIAAAAVAVPLVVVLAHQNRELRAEAYLTKLDLSRQHVGMAVPEFTATSLSGREVTVGARQQVLLFFTTTCVYCEATLPAWEKVRSALSRIPDLEVLGISLDPERETRAYMDAHGFSPEVVLLPEGRERRLFRAGSVPASVVVGEDGTITYVRHGSFDPDAPAVDSLLSAATAASVEPEESTTSAQL